MRTQLWCALALVCFVGGNRAQADWRVTSSQRESPPNELVEHWTTTVENSQTNEEATLHLAVFEIRAATLTVIDQPKTPRSELAEAMVRNKALAGVNGGYFDPEDAPVGLLVSEGRVVSRFQKAKLLTSVLVATKSKVDVVRASRFVLTDKIQAAVQCGPLLAERAAPVPGLNDSRPARRTFATVDGKGRAGLGICSAVSLAQLGRILCLTNTAGSFKIARALNLDGGSSSAFWFAGEERAVSLPEQKTVRDFVAIVPRSGR